MSKHIYPNYTLGDSKNNHRMNSGTDQIHHQSVFFFFSQNGINHLTSISSYFKKRTAKPFGVSWKQSQFRTSIHKPWKVLLFSFSQCTVTAVKRYRCPWGRMEERLTGKSQLFQQGPSSGKSDLTFFHDSRSANRLKSGIWFTSRDSLLLQSSTAIPSFV